MPQNGPIAIAAVAGHGIALAHYFSSGCCQCPRVGPLYWQELLPLGLLWPIMFLADPSNGFAWANLLSSRCSRISMPLAWPAAFATASASRFSWDDYIFQEVLPMP